jgi:Glycosyltransferase family 9 (heptosyltransferase)
MWDGSNLEDRAILLYAEQGLGDTLQFLRYAPFVKKRGGKVIVECQPHMLRLLERSPGVDQWVSHGGPLPEFHMRAPLPSLPGIFHTELATIPRQVPYVFADPNLVSHWRAELEGQGGYKVGIAWQGNPAYRDDRQRSISLTHFAKLAEIQGIRLISLQKGHGTDQLRTIDFEVLNLCDRLDESSGAFMDTAAVMKNLDLVITSDTAIPHLAGALGVPVWTLLNMVPDWRWLQERRDSPWYPSMRLFRQSRYGDWQSVFEQVAAKLRERHRDSILNA